MTDSLVVNETLLKLTQWLTYATIASAICAVVIGILAVLTYWYTKKLNKAYIRIIPLSCKTYISKKDSIKYKRQKMIIYELIFDSNNVGKEPAKMDSVFLWYVNFNTEEYSRKKDTPILSYLAPEVKNRCTIKFEDEPTAPYGSITRLQSEMKADFLFVVMVKYYNTNSILKLRNTTWSLFLFDLTTQESSNLNDERYNLIKKILPRKLQQIAGL